VNRTYDPTTGRFIQFDPIGYADSMNLYEYVLSNPMNFIDPMGTNLYAIGGTWEQKNDNYYVYKFHSRFIGDKGKKVESGSRYWDGPGFKDYGIVSYSQIEAEPSKTTREKDKSKASWGVPSESIALDVKNYICSQYCANTDMQINLVGWSRGGAIALKVSDLLVNEGCNCCDYKCKYKGMVYPRVNWMGLFDAVDMTTHLNPPSVIPYNVGQTDHIIKTSQKERLFPTMELKQDKANLPGQKLNIIPLKDTSVKGVTRDSNHGYLGAGKDNSALKEMIRRAQSAGLRFNTDGLN
jgi:hypothetical protein